MTAEQLKTHSAAHTLKFIEDEYVEKDDDAAHYTWNDILNAVRTPRTTLFAWADSFTLRTLRYSETIEKISGVRLTKINKIIAKQITDDEKLTLSTLNSAYSSINIQEGAYEFNDLVKLLAQNVTSFTKAYQPTEHPRINRYLHTRARKHGDVPEFMRSSSKGKGGKLTNKRKPNTNPAQPQRAWSYLQKNSPNTLVSPSPYAKGKGQGDLKGKGKPKGMGKQSSKGKSLSKGGWTNPKGKTKGLNPKGKGMAKGNPFV
jgi:hypothetical protein